MSCSPGQLPAAAKEASLAESVPVLVTLPVAAPHIQKELQAPAEGETRLACHEEQG
jgi:hypothetical protein